MIPSTTKPPTTPPTIAAALLAAEWSVYQEKRQRERERERLNQVMLLSYNISPNSMSWVVGPHEILEDPMLFSAVIMKV